jgi:hypothetical protein
VKVVIGGAALCFGDSAIIACEVDDEIDQFRYIKRHIQS